MAPMAISPMPPTSKKATSTGDAISGGRKGKAGINSDGENIFAPLYTAMKSQTWNMPNPRESELSSPVAREPSELRFMLTVIRGSGVDKRCLSD